MNMDKRARPHGPQEYKGNRKHAWELVTGEYAPDVYTTRLRVPGGWLYHVATLNTTSVTFVPVPEAVGYVV